MMTSRLFSTWYLPVSFAVGLALLALWTFAVGQANSPRSPWTTSHIHGTPEPPLPYRLERVFPALHFAKLTHLTAAPKTRRLFVTQEIGLVSSIDPATDPARAEPFLDLSHDVPGAQPAQDGQHFGQLFSLTFHPQFPEKPYCYVVYTFGKNEAEPFPGVERVSRFTVTATEPPRADPQSEQILLEWPPRIKGHLGSTVCFGPDGFLYVSIGDGGPASPPDLLHSGQDLGKLQAKILRIDVDQEENGKHYKIPPDNPFINTPGARPEIWAYGVRNPWKMSFDKSTGNLWVGDVGWEMWEMVYRIRKGANYGWSIMEGPQPVHPEWQRGPTPIMPPNLALPHSEGASITGGFIYHGKEFPELAGSYVFGDYVTLRVWSARFDEDRLVSRQEIARAPEPLVAIGEANDGELYFLGYGDAGGIYHLVKAKATIETAKFPTKLSETGLFQSTAELKPDVGVLPYTINTEMWADGASAERWVALPDLSTVKIHDEPILIPLTSYYKTRNFYPKDAVLAKTLYMEMERGKPETKRRLETQILHFDGQDWHPYSYRWNAAQTDAELVTASGAEEELDIVDPSAPGGRDKLTWHFASRAQCQQCHNGRAGTALSFTPEQLSRDSQLDKLRSLAIITRVNAQGEPTNDPVRVTYPLADPYDAKEKIDVRARSYLNVNCAHCHQRGAGGTTTIELNADLRLDDMMAVGVSPAQGNFGLTNAKIVAPGLPYQSVLFYRIAKTGAGRMPHIGSDVVDSQALGMVSDWISFLPKRSADKTDPTPAELLLILYKIGEQGNIPTRPAILARVMSSTSDALCLAVAFDSSNFPALVRDEIINAAMAQSDPQIRDLFERFLPPEQRSKRLGMNIQSQTILNLKGNADLGRVLFFQPGALQCASCHKIQSIGGNLGPDLSQIGKKYDRAKILENILDPSKEIEPAYLMTVVARKDGKIASGLVVRRDEKEIVLKDAKLEEIRIPAADIESVSTSRQSIMPEQLLRDLTAQQAADLVEFLAGLKGE